MKSMTFLILVSLSLNTLAIVDRESDKQNTKKLMEFVHKIEKLKTLSESNEGHFPDGRFDETEDSIILVQAFELAEKVKKHQSMGEDYRKLNKKSYSQFAAIAQKDFEYYKGQLTSHLGKSIFADMIQESSTGNQSEDLLKNFKVGSRKVLEKELATAQALNDQRNSPACLGTDHTSIGNFSRNTIDGKFLRPVAIADEDIESVLTSPIINASVGQ